MEEKGREEIGKERERDGFADSLRAVGCFLMLNV